MGKMPEAQNFLIPPGSYKNPINPENPVMTVADDIHKYFFSVFQRKLDMIFHVIPLLGGSYNNPINP